MKKFFYLDETPLYKGKYIIYLNHDLFLFPHGTNGSYGVFASRVLGLSYTDYLRYCRDRLGAELIGKNRHYIVVYFDYTPEAKALVKLLNKRMEYIMNLHDNPYNYELNEDGELTRSPLYGSEDG